MSIVNWLQARKVEYVGLRPLLLVNWLLARNVESVG
jgi:hypothetical protein